MSLEITLYSKTSTKSSLIQSIKNFGFKKAKHFIQEMNNPDALHFMWYGSDDYESLDGVEAAVIKASTEDRLKYKCSDWILHTRTRSSASYEDKKMQNEVVKTIRKAFGGSFYNDWYGTNTYTNLSDYDRFKPLEKGLSIIAHNSLDKLQQITNCLVGYRNELSESIASQPIELKALFVRQDPSVILYNSLIPFLVSVLEYFFGQSLAHFMKYDNLCKQVLAEEKIKLGVQDVIKIIEREESIEQLVLETYNFQNLESINKAYKKYLNIDLKAILSIKWIFWTMLTPLKCA